MQPDVPPLQQALQQALRQYLPQYFKPIHQKLQTLVHRTSPALWSARQHNSRALLPTDALAPVPHPDTGVLPLNFPATNDGELQSAGNSRRPGSDLSVPSWPGVPFRSSMCSLAAGPTKSLAPSACMSLPQHQQGSVPNLEASMQISIDRSSLLPVHLPVDLEMLSYAQLGKLLAFYDRSLAGNTLARRNRLKAFIGKQ